MTRHPESRPGASRGRSTVRPSTIGWRIGLVIAGYLAYTAAITTLEGRQPAPVSAEALGASSDSAREGSRVWARYGCATCHSLVGLGGHVGPDLTNYGRPESHAVVRTTVASGRIAMPSFSLSEQELDHLVAYLATVSRSATFPPRSVRDPVFGDGDR